MPDKIYLVFSQQALSMGAGSCTANVLIESGDRMDVIYTVMVKGLKEIEWSDKKIVWEGAEKDIQNIRPNSASADLILIASIAARIRLRGLLNKRSHDGKKVTP
jgi:hypothetical protein